MFQKLYISIQASYLSCHLMIYQSLYQFQKRSLRQTLKRKRHIFIKIKYPLQKYLPRYISYRGNNLNNRISQIQEIPLYLLGTGWGGASLFLVNCG